MADGVELVVIGYPDEATAEKAYEVVVQLEHDLVIHETAPVPRTLLRTEMPRQIVLAAHGRRVFSLPRQRRTIV
jgi:hypothetical protein